MPQPGIVKPTGRDIASNEIRETKKGYLSLAVATGSNDNSAMSDAIAALPTDGGVIEMGNAIHYLDAAVIGTAAQKAVTFKGVAADPTGLTGTRIRPSNTTSGNPVIKATGSFKTPVIEDLTIDCTTSRTNPCFSLIGSSGTSGYAAAAKRCVFLNGHASGMSSTGGRNGALTELDGSASWGEIIADFDDCKWIHGGPSTSNMYLRSTNLHLKFKNRKMSMGIGGINLDCEAAGWINDDHPYVAGNGITYAQANVTGDSPYKTITCGLTSGSRLITGTFTLEDTGHNVRGTGISGTGVWITKVESSSRAYISSAATSTTSSSIAFRYNYRDPSTLGGADIYFRGTHGTYTRIGGDDEGIVDLIRYATDQYGGVINLFGVYTPSRFAMMSGRALLNIQGGDKFSGFIYSTGGALYVNCDPEAFGSYNPSSIGPASVTLVGGTSVRVESPVLCSRKDGTVVVSNQHSWMQDFNQDSATSAMRIEKQELATKFFSPLTLGSPPTGGNNPLTFSVVYAVQDYSGATNDTVYFAGGMRDQVTGKLAYGHAFRRNASDGAMEILNSQDAEFTTGSLLVGIVRAKGAIQSTSFAQFANLYKPTSIVSKSTLADADMFGVYDSVPGGNPQVSHTWANLKTALDARYPAATLDTDGTMAANSDTRVPSQKAVNTRLAAAVTGTLRLKGDTDCSSNPNYPAGVVGDQYYVRVAGKIGGASGKVVDIGDVYVCKTDNAGGTEGSVGTSWFVLEHNLTGVYYAGGTAVAITDGGTGASTAAGAATNLGLGTGNSPQFAGVNVGHATDTTITRVSAGDIAVEGQQIYRANGTDVPIIDGGTGASSAPSARTNLGVGTGDTPSFLGVRATGRNSSTGGIGYSDDGSVNYVFQSTNKTTDVTANGICGIIEASSTGLATGTKAAFKVSNSSLLNGDYVELTAQMAGWTTSNLNQSKYWIEKWTNGEFYIVVENTSGSTDSNAYYLRYYIHKGYIHT